MAPADPPRKRGRRIWKFLAAVSLLLAATVAALPWLASTPPARRSVLAMANRALAPSSVEASGIQLSWFRPIRVSGLVLRDKAGKAILSASRATLNRGLLALATARPIRGTVLVEDLVVDVERRGDGSIDLLDALIPLLQPGPAPQGPVQAPQGPRAQRPVLNVKVANGSIRLRAPELPDGFDARKMGVSLRLPDGTGPLTWQVALAGPAEGDVATLELSGELNLPTVPGAGPDLALKLTGKRWPWAVASSGTVARGRLDGTLDATRKGGLWGVAGNVQVVDLDASGPALAGDRLRLASVGGSADITETATAWDVRHLDLGCALGSLKAVGTASATGARRVTSRIEGRLDLAALARQLPHLLHVRDGLTVQRGSAQIVVDLHDGAATSGPAKGPGENSARSRSLAIQAEVSDLVAHDGTREIAVRAPATLIGRVSQGDAGLRVEGLTLKTAFLNASGSGDFERGIALSAAVDLEGFQKELHELIDFGGLELAGKGRLAADYRRGGDGTYAARFAAEFRSARVAGLAAAPIARDLVHIDATAAGPAAATGLPSLWSRARLALKADDLDAEATLARDGSDPAVRIDAAKVALRLPPPPSQAEGEVVRVALRGRYVPGPGTLELRPVAGSSPEPFALAGDGVVVTGIGGKELRVTANLVGDLARLDRALAAWGGSAPDELAGTATVLGSLILGEGGKLETNLAIQSPDLSLPESSKPARQLLGPSAVALHAVRAAGADRLDCDQLVVACRYGALGGSGSLADPSGRRLADVQGTVTPNWPAIDLLMAQSVEPAAKVRFAPRPFRLKGPLSGAGLGQILRGLDAELALDQFTAVAFGLKVEPTPVVVRCVGNRVTIDPIATSINGGPARLLPEVAIDDSGAIVFRLAPGSTLQGVEINDDVSRGLLAYIAPMLHDATQVHGKVSASVERAEFPVVGAPGAHTNVVGKIQFDDVVCIPGPSASQLLGLVGSGRAAGVRLHQPVELNIADGRVNQKGLSIAIGHHAKIELEGSVGFDSTLAMRAKVPIAAGVLGHGEGIDEVVEGLRAGIPIGGTLSHPTIDRRALRLGLRDSSKEALKRNAADLLKRLAQPDGDPEKRPR